MKTKAQLQIETQTPIEVNPDSIYQPIERPEKKFSKLQVSLLENLEFHDDGVEEHILTIQDHCIPHLEKACKLLGLDSQKLQQTILEKQLIVGGKVITKKLNKIQVLDKRDTLAKVAYSRLFIWLVHCVNETISADLKQSTKDEDEHDSPVKTNKRNPSK